MERATDLAGVLQVTRPGPLTGDDFDRFHRPTEEARGADPIANLRVRLENPSAKPQRFLFTGHPGCGKSTELWRLANKHLRDSYWTVNFSARDELDINDLGHIDLVIAVMERLAAAAKEGGLKVSDAGVKSIVGWLREESIVTETARGGGVEAGLDLGGLLGALAALKGTLKFSKDTKRTIVERVEPRLSQLLDRCNVLVAAINNQLARQGKRLLLIIEDLDKLAPGLARSLFLDHGATLTGIDCDAIFTIPVFTLFSRDSLAIRRQFDDDEILPMIKVRERGGQIFKYGVATINTILDARLEPRLLAEDGREMLLRCCGGSLFDTFKALNRAAVEALRREREQISKDDILTALRLLRNDYERSISQRSVGGAVQIEVRQYYEKLAALANDPLKKPDHDDVLLDLLYMQCVLEYDGGDRWCDVHPLVLDILKERGLTKRGGCTTPDTA